MITFSDATKDIQNRFGCGKLAERMVQHVFHQEFTDKDRAFISNAMFFFLATVDANGQPQCSYKGGGKGFVKVTGPSELVFPFYEGNGMYMSAGNIAAMGKIGLLFVDFEGQTRIRVNGVARIDDDHAMNDEVSAAQLVVRLAVSDIHPNCSRNVHKMQMVETSSYTPKSDAENVVAAPWGERFTDVLPDFMKSRD
ncbi:MAG: putative pyridoxine 5'-phosphate oxidase superfamily flavin-nucleotide-binding protein [Paracoccaceae bacterium]|jgi:predicted pyridoxine 5'-phosphate oxidase superfamily flavin-nucleotide-binding protein